MNMSLLYAKANIKQNCWNQINYNKVISFGVQFNNTNNSRKIVYSNGLITVYYKSK